MELLNTLAEAITNQYIASLLILIVAVLFFYRNAITKLITPSKKKLTILSFIQTVNLILQKLKCVVILLNTKQELLKTV
jgi:hypothetical protein